MNQSVDKAADKLMASIQKSQDGTEESSAPETTVTEKPEPAPKLKARRKPAAKKEIEKVAISSESDIETPRRFVGNLRWPD